MTFPDLGCNFEGLLDAQAILCKGYDDEQIAVAQSPVIPATLVLPERKFQKFLTGIESYESRICRGYSWPTESRFDPKNGIRRIPVSLAWQLLVAAGDKRAYWRSTDKHSVALSEIIAEHTINLLPPEKDSHIVLSIPNNLHEFGQDAIITSLRKRGCKATLLWRPIAAAIDWCSRLSQIEIRRIVKDDPFYFIHFGPDLFEFVPLHIRKVERDGKNYAVPIRALPSVTPPLISGSLILASVAEHIAESKYHTRDIGVIWQIFTSLSQLWSIEYGILGSNSEKQFIDTGNGWNIFTDKIDQFINDSFVLHSPEWLIESSKLCCDIDIKPSDHNNPFLNITQWVEEQIKLLVSNCKDDEPGGAIISGQFRNFKCNGSETLQDIVIRVLDKEINLGFQNNQAAATYIYNDSNIRNDHIAEGCLKYVHKKIKKLPAYYDVLPKIDIKVQDKDRGGYRWETLVTTDEIEGGETYSHKIENRFSVLPGTKHIDFFLRRMDSEHRTLPFDFPAPVPVKILVDLHIKMKPAQGFASIELIPDKPELFGAKHLFLDWQRMAISEDKPFKPLDRKQIGYPEVFISFKSHLNVFINNEHKFTEYINISAGETRYKQILDNLKQTLKAKEFINGKFYVIVDSNGMISESTENSLFNDYFTEKVERAKILVRKTITKLDSEIKAALGNQSDLYSHLENLITTSSFFFINAPEQCNKYLKLLLMTKRTEISQDTIYAIGRNFHFLDEVRLFFEIAIERIKIDKNNTNTWVWGINKILMHREEAYQALTREQALFLVSFARDRMKDELNRQNIYVIFKNSANLFLYLLRWRKIEPSFLAQIPEEYELAKEVKHILTDAVKYAENKHVEIILKQIAKYIEFKGDDIITGLTVD